MEAAFTEQESDFPLQFPAPSFPSLGKVSETTSPSHRRNFGLSPPLPPPVIFHKVPKDVGERFDCTRSGRRTLQAPDAGPLSEPSPRITSPLALPRTRASNPNYRGAPRSLPVPFQDRRAPRPAARVPCLRCPTLSIPESLSGSEDPRAASLGADPVGTAEKCAPRAPRAPAPLTLGAAVLQELAEQQQQQAEPAGLVPGAAHVGAGAGRAAAGARAGAEAGSGGRRILAQPRARRRPPRASMDVGSRAQPRLNAAGGLGGVRWAVSQGVGPREGGRRRGCARLLGGGELLKVQCESGDISHLLETLPNDRLEVPAIPAAGGESPSSYCVGARGRGAATGAGVGATLRGWGAGKNTHFQPARRSQAAPGGGCE